MDQMSEIDSYVVASAEQSTGAGELAMPMFATTGEYLRQQSLRMIG
jgi:hypothetical protein